MSQTPMNLAARREALLSLKPNRFCELGSKWCFRLVFVTLGLYWLVYFVLGIELREDFLSALGQTESSLVRVLLAVVRIVPVMVVAGMLLGLVNTTAMWLRDFRNIYQDGELTVATPKGKPPGLLSKLLDIPESFGLFFSNRSARSLGFESTKKIGFPATIEENGKKRYVRVITDKSREEWAAGRVVEVYTLPDSKFAISGEFRDRLKNA